jgi:hypothetical protein
MSVQVLVPTRIRLDTAALHKRGPDIVEAVAAATVRALRNSRDVALAPRGGYLGVRLQQPEFAWTGDGLADVTVAQRAELEGLISAVLARAARDAGIYDFVKQAARAPLPLPDEISEPYDPERHDPLFGVYAIPIYQGGGEQASITFEPEVITSAVRTRDVWDNVDTDLKGPRLKEVSLTALRRWAHQIPPFPWGLIMHGTKRHWQIMVWRDRTSPSMIISFDNFWKYRYAGPKKDPPFTQEPMTPPPDVATVQVLEPGAGSGADQWIEPLRGVFAAEIRFEITKHRPQHELERSVEYEPQVEAQVDAELKRRAGSIKGDVGALLLLRLGSYTGIGLIPTKEKENYRWDGVAKLFPVSHVEIATEPDGGKGEGDGDGKKAAGSGAAGRAGAGGGTGTGEGEGAGQPGGFIETDGEGTPEPNAPLLPSTGGEGEPLVCASFNGEPSLEELGKDGDRLRHMIEQVAFRLQIPTCNYAGQFCINAARALGGRAKAVTELALDLPAFSQPAPEGKGNLGGIHFRPVASPAIQFMRHLATVVPQLANLGREIERSYPAHRNQIQGYDQGDSVAWSLHFYEEFTPKLSASIGWLFIFTCRIVLMQLLRTSQDAIMARLNNFNTYAPLFEQLVRYQLANVAELLTLRAHLQSFQRLESVNAAAATAGQVTGDMWMAATKDVTDAMIGRELAPQATTGPTGQIVKQGGVAYIRDSSGQLWSMYDIESAMATQRGTAESIDPLVKQLTDIPDIVQQLRADPRALRRELRRLLWEMARNNNEMQQHVSDDVMYAFRAGRISEDLDQRTIEGTSYALQGIHLLAHEQIREFFRGDSFYAKGIDDLFSAELGRHELIEFFTFTGLVLLSVICPPAAFVAGVAVATYELDQAYERKRLYGALIDPEAVITRAEVEAELWAAWAGFVLSFIPELPAALRAGKYGVRAVAKAGVEGGARIVGRYVVRRITTQIVEALARDLAVAFAREVVTAYVLQKVMQAAMEPILEQIQREALVTGPVGGLGGAAGVRQFLKEEQSKTNPNASATGEQ